MTATKLTFETVKDIAVKTCDDYRERNMQAQFERCGSWEKVRNDWTGWDDQVRVLSAAEYREEYGDAPADVVAAIGADLNWSLVTESDTAEMVRREVLNNLPDENED